MTDENRELGVEIGPLQDDLQEHDYPASHDELVAEYGDRELELSEETVTFEDLIGPLNQEEYADYGDVEQAIMNMVGDEAIGRKNYSDRTPYAPGEQRQEEGAPDQDVDEEQESF